MRIVLSLACEAAGSRHGARGDREDRVKIDAGDTAWVLASAGLVMFMTPGLALFYGGMVRAKHVLAMLMQNFFALGLVSVLWALIGYTLAFGGSGRLVGNLDFVGLTDAARVHAFGFSGLTIPPLVFMAYQMMFAVITPALITGAIADRMRFSAWVWLLGLWAILVYAPVAHWVFSPAGWAFRLGALDFAGGTVVHINAGIAALACVMVLGRRRGWPQRPMPPHNLPLTMIGTGILWFGWFGFNAGSALGANALAAQALVNTHLAAAAAMLGWLVVERARAAHATTLGAASGAVAGLVAITPCAGYVGGLASLVIGAIAGVVCYFAINLKQRLRFDDALDVVGVHLVGGLWGTLSVGLFASAATTAGVDGLFYGGGLDQLWRQAVGALAVLVYSFVISYALGLAIQKTIGFRVSDENEIAGIDNAEHAETAYDLVSLGSGASSGTSLIGQAHAEARNTEGARV
jgi:ammonium transporter, Amt family